MEPRVQITTSEKEITIRTGEAERIQYAKAINIAGILAAPHQFLKGKDLDSKQCHIQIQKDKGIIELHILDTDPNSKSLIKGSLTPDGYFTAWGINTSNRWTVSSFLKHIKMQRAFFSVPDECDQMVASLQKWNARVETIIKQHNDNSGNSLSMLERKVDEIDLKKTFDLTIPIFQGYPKQKFTVEIGFDPKSTQVDLYLFSNELFELEIIHRENLINEELSKFDSFECSKVVIS